MIVLTNVAQIISVVFAVLLGNRIGGLIRYLITDKHTQTIY